MDEDRKIIRETKNTDYINSNYEIGDKEVSFPWIMFFVCIFIDILDIVLSLTGFGLVPWWVFTMFVFTPILLWYINSRNKEFSIKSIETSIETRSSISSAKEAGKLTREAKALNKAGKTAAALDKAADAAKKIQKLPPWLRSLFVVFENIPVIEFLPLNSIMLVMAYSDNKNSIKEAKDAMANLSKNLDFKIDKPITRPKGSAVSK